MSNIKLLVDIDNSVANTSTAWWKWMCEVYNHKLTPTKEHTDYNSSVYFREAGNGIKIDPFYFFDRDNEPYNLIQPIRGSKEALWKLSMQGFDIIFVSHIIGDHFENKLEWLEKHYPFMRGFIGTKQKHLVEGDVLIDDRNDRLNKCSLPVKIKFDSIFDQQETLNVTNPDGTNLDYLISSNWEEIADYLLTMKEILCKNNN